MPVILACPGSGKSYFCEKSKLWKDQDKLMSNLHNEDWHNVEHTQEEEKAHYQRIDKELEKQTKRYYIMGSLFWDFVPDAIVVIPDKTLRKRVSKRSDLSYTRVKKIEAVLKAMAKKHDVRVFDNFKAASLYVLLNPTKDASKLKT